jgi:hypothetical protein
VFPDARFVMTHRDPASVIPSVSDVYYELRKAFTDDLDMVALGEETAAFCELKMRRMIAFRDAGNDHRFFDIHYAPFQDDPFPALEALYAFLGEPFTDAARTAMQSWREARPLAAQAYEKTPMAQFGLDPATLRDRFAFYLDRFGMAPAKVA